MSSLGSWPTRQRRWLDPVREVSAKVAGVIECIDEKV